LEATEGRGVPKMKLFAPQTTELKPRIVVFGVGGAGGNAVNNMIEAGLEGVEFVVANTDAQQLAFSKTPLRIQLGVQVTQGLGAGAHPEVGMSAAEESTVEIGEHLDGAHMVFITAGMGGGTGTGAAPIIAKSARERGILTVGVVTKPFHFEGRHRMRLADAGIAELQRYVDTLIVIPNQNLFRIANEKTTFAEAFGMADQVLHSGVRSITDLMVLPGLINLDFADVRTVMTEMGKAMMGTGEASGEDRALMAAQNAIQNPLLDEVSLKGAKAVLVNVTGGLDMTLLEVDEAANAITEQVDQEANVIFGAAFDPSLDGVIRVSVVATGMDGASMAAIEPNRGRVNTSAKPLIAGGMQASPAPEARPVPATASIDVAVEQSWAIAGEPRIVEAPRPEPVTIAGPNPPVAEPRIQSGPGLFEQTAADARQIDYRQSEFRQAEVRQPEARTVIVDPMVDDEVYDDGLSVGQPPEAHREERRSGWLSLFSGRRPAMDGAPPPARASVGGRPVPQASEETAPEEQGDDLEIPSFLRRLAN
jgi:cell division protein FtsZ